MLIPSKQHRILLFLFLCKSKYAFTSPSPPGQVGGLRKSPCCHLHPVVLEKLLTARIQVSGWDTLLVGGKGGHHRALFTPPGWHGALQAGRTFAVFLFSVYVKLQAVSVPAWQKDLGPEPKLCPAAPLTSELQRALQEPSTNEGEPGRGSYIHCRHILRTFKGAEMAGLRQGLAVLSPPPGLASWACPRALAQGARCLVFTLVLPSWN